ncbi:MAG TPA: phage protein Gp36 family protein, partial [Candidatus Limnocylindria bacterium]|nr:phage protein Gp36 family protein [Candidatus Limnocylindria bacterium]
LEVFRRDCATAGKADPVAEILSDVAGLVRGHVVKVAALGATGTIPEKLRGPALDIAAFRLTTRMGLEPTRAQETGHRDALRLLASVAAGEFDIDEPPPAEVSQPAATARPRITARNRQFTRQKQDGL